MNWHNIITMDLQVHQDHIIIIFLLIKHYIFANKAGSPINPNVGINISASQTPCATSFRDNWGGENYSIVGTTTSATLGKTASNGSHTHTVTTNNNGNNVAHNNMQPYIVVYRYRRKA